MSQVKVRRELAESSAARLYLAIGTDLTRLARPLTPPPVYLMVACTVMTDVPEAFGPLPVALMAKVSFPLYLAFVLYS